MATPNDTGSEIDEILEDAGIKDHDIERPYGGIYNPLKTTKAAIQSYTDRRVKKAVARTLLMPGLTPEQQAFIESELKGQD